MEVMELRQLKYFVAVADELHFGRAAARLHMTQPPLTVAVRKLEDELGVPLFERTTRSVSLTAAGRMFRQRVGAVLDDLDAAVSDLGDVAAGTAGRLRIGFVSSASYSVLPRGLQAFQLLRPRIQLEPQSLTSAEQVTLLLEGELDVGILRDPLAVPGLSATLLEGEDLVAVLPAGDPLAAEAIVGPGSFHGKPVVLFPFELMPGFVSAVMSWLRGAQAVPRIVQSVVHQETVLGLVAAGVGASILPASVARFHMPGVVARPLLGSPRTELYAVEGQRSHPSSSLLIESLRDSR
ncbi:LysR family transcriptional regulator [Pseudoclavibacter sp. RFBI5]|uniref:LysR substrate-binding domain-containing protein n=1 Tax=Pseudoclavibacter sp. RFBI5 TaxID=2080578 RepID=UPI000CE81070|nr:LysR substrate-binding domain-containing protein [Pseudoclavibacter sp. RFBI5]PPG04893.1 LysR family transcriptional regulator [Pseudoclavibacter sp. RFBI5]